VNYSATRGDTLGTIAQKFLGSSSRWRDIWEANPNISNPDRISVGQIITIPGQSQAQSSLIPANVSLPITTQSPKASVQKNTMTGGLMAAALGVGAMLFVFKN
jgi:LysM repeat protein